VDVPLRVNTNAHRWHSKTSVKKIRADVQDVLVQFVFSTPCMRQCSSVSTSILYLTKGCHHVQHWYLTPRRLCFPPVYIYLQKSTKCTQPFTHS